MSETALAVTGMTCDACARHIEQALRTVAAVRAVRVEYPKSVVRIEGDAPLALDTLNAALPKSYRVRSLTAADASGEAPPARSLLGKAWGAFGGSRQTRTGSQLPLNIAIIGTGGGAMAAAITAAERGPRSHSSSAGPSAGRASTSGACPPRS
jgi:mercuric reductase